ncbi:hypothetical protein M8312_00780 [Sphingomonas sp. KRR8]|uniref:hypothetical protein n=1 Tax=Sphingomonas sp. KRR8 TaxID=2942996 RepID=UPI002022478B|nr:hypothetical protein [Sphingomonas sp. KRR8]URD61088.1 hypothetical protein M8312_00780 [Sphingomonas sp. KRR8]
MADDELNERLLPLLSHYLPEGSERSPAGELRDILALPPSVREAIIARLEAIARFDKEPGTASADAEAARLGMKRRNFYNLVARLRLDGPIKALSPSKTGYRRPSALEPGLGDLVEQTIGNVLRGDPSSSATRVIEAVRSECDLHQIKPPSDRTIRLRLAALQAKNIAPLAGDALLGREILIDQTAAAFVLTGEEERLGLINVVADVGTRLILAVGVGQCGKTDSGLARLLLDWETRRSTLPWDRFENVIWPETIEWIVPDELADEARQWSRNAALSDITALTTTKGERRHGRRLTAVLGRKLGWLDFLPRRTEHALVPASEAAAKFPRLEANEAQAAIAALATAWNEKLASASPLHRQDSNNHGLGWVFGSLETMLRHSAEWHALLHATKR